MDETAYVALQPSFTQSTRLEGVLLSPTPGLQQGTVVISVRAQNTLGAISETLFRPDGQPAEVDVLPPPPDLGVVQAQQLQDDITSTDEDALYTSAGDAVLRLQALA